MKFTWILFVATLMLYLAYAEEGQQCSRNGNDCSENEHCSKSKRVCVPNREYGNDCKFNSECKPGQICEKGYCIVSKTPIYNNVPCTDGNGRCTTVTYNNDEEEN